MSRRRMLLPDRFAFLMALEGLALALLAGALGTAIAVFAVRLMVTLAPDSIPRLHAVGMDPRLEQRSAIA